MQHSLLTITPRGGQILCLQIKSLMIKFIDSFVFVPLGLRKFPDCFGILDEKKGNFPHLMNKIEYKDGPMPPQELWQPQQMTEAQRKDFEKWYQKCIEDDYVVNFQEEIVR